MTGSGSFALDVKRAFMALQDDICATLVDLERAAGGSTEFDARELPGPGGGVARPRVIADGRAIEKAAVQFTHSVGANLPPAATERNPEYAGRGFQAVAISLIVHPVNPFVPTTHMNLRYFQIEPAQPDQEPAWYFGGGFDLTPYYGFIDDCRHWHQMASDATGEHYPALKAACDDYFYLPHRGEHRGIGGLFFDDWTQDGIDASFDLVEQVGAAFLLAYAPIFRRRMDHPWTAANKQFQEYRRGRYAEFNLAIDRGTKYGLQSGRRIESVLASLPPTVRWWYDYQPQPGSAEAALTEYFLVPRDWLVVDNSGD